MVSVFSLDTKVKHAFSTLFHKFNVNFSSFDRSSHIINLAQDEHMSLRSFTRTCMKHTKKKACIIFTHGHKVLYITQITRYKLMK
jgi:hypothetical protein